MAKPVGEEELQLKKRARRRLMGAIVLVAAVAVILPMVLDSEPKSTSQEINIQIPSPDAKGFTSKVVPLTSSKGVPESKGETKAAADKPTPAAKAPEPATETVVAEKSAPKPASKPVPEKAAAKAPEKVVPKPGTFFIQVTALADPEKAKQVEQRIMDAGFPAYTQAIPAGKGSVTRVRAGPFATRDEANKAQATLQGVGLEGKVATHP